MALEYASANIWVNVISPGNVAADSSLKVFEEDSAYREFVLRISLGRRNSPEAIAMLSYSSALHWPTASQSERATAE